MSSLSEGQGLAIICLWKGLLQETLCTKDVITIYVQWEVETDTTVFLWHNDSAGTVYEDYANTIRGHTVMAQVKGLYINGPSERSLYQVLLKGKSAILLNVQLSNVTEAYLGCA